MLPFSLAMVEKLKYQRRLCCYVVGNANATVEAKLNWLRRYRKTGKCWTTKHRRWDDLHPRASEQVSYSREIYALAKRAGIS